jgi:formylglycine-generating enzyme required for sulfatase activity
MVLLDGLDEAPSEQDRRRLVKLIEDAARVYGKCRFVVTSRPAAYVGDALLPGFVQARIDDLENDAIDLFLKRWCEELYPESPKVARDHHAELLDALRTRPEIRRLARNAVMLTALAVVHWDKKRLPEQRADLYESILEKLAASRPRPGRQSPERCIGLLQNLALAMQDHPKGRQVQVPRYWAAREIARAWREAPDEDRAGLAEQFLKDEELDSGIVVGRGDDTRFWHLTFQEYLAGRGLAARDERRQAFVGREELYQPEWREVILLLAGVLYHQGPERVDGMVAAILDRLDSGLSSKQALGEQARAVGLLGAIVRDLAPVRYQPGDERYKQALDAVLGIFDAEKARSIGFNVRLEAAEALGQAGDPRLGRDNWITIPAGKFWMGAQKDGHSKPNYDPEADENEAPVHEVYLNEYQIGRYPVTVEEYRRFVDDDGYSHERWWKDGGFVPKNRPQGWDDQVLHPNWPVVNVSWFEATAYCAWARRRLPTEAEWERAARGTNGRKYPWGNEKPDATRANYDAGKVGHPTPVGLYPRGATPEGIEELAGNVLEWVADWYGEGYYARSPVKDPNGPQSGSMRVLRGCGWLTIRKILRAACRRKFEPYHTNYDFGFRCVREVIP